MIFFSASKSKLPGYILPAVPALVLLLAAAASRIRCNRDDAARGVTMGLGATWLALVVGAGFWLHRQLPTSPFAQAPAPAMSDTATPYRVLARKYRPQTFSELVSQEHVRTTIENAITQRRIAHGYIFAGQRGTGSH